LRGFGLWLRGERKGLIGSVGTETRGRKKERDGVSASPGKRDCGGVHEAACGRCDSNECGAVAAAETRVWNYQVGACHAGWRHGEESACGGRLLCAVCAVRVWKGERENVER